MVGLQPVDVNTPNRAVQNLTEGAYVAPSRNLTERAGGKRAPEEGFDESAFASRDAGGDGDQVPAGGEDG
jgi:hypothetical protein